MELAERHFKAIALKAVLQPIRLKRKTLIYCPPDEEPKQAYAVQCAGSIGGHPHFLPGMLSSIEAKRNISSAASIEWILSKRIRPDAVSVFMIPPGDVDIDGILTLCDSGLSRNRFQGRISSTVGARSPAVPW
jgi:hypothetical protein